MEQIFQQCVLEKKAEGKSILFSSHILSEVERLSDRVSIIREGEIIETGLMDELRHLTRIQLMVRTDNSLDELQTMNGVYDLEETVDGLYFHVDREALSAVLSSASHQKYLMLEIISQSLEEQSI